MLQSNPNQRSHGQWNMVLEHQRQQQLLRDQLQKDDEQRRKLIYRDELQKLMDEQRFQRSQDKNIDQEQVQRVDDQLKLRDFSDFKKQFDAKLKAREFIGISMDLDKQKKQKEYDYNANSQEQERQVTILLQRREQEEQYKKMMNKDKIKQDLTQSYKQMEQRKQNDKFVQQQSEREVYELEQDRMRSQDIQRNNFLERLKSGYNQNQVVLQSYNQIYHDKDKQKQKFLQKFVDQAEEKRLQDDFLIQSQTNHINKLKNDTQQTVMNQIILKQQQAQVYQDEKKYDLHNLQNQQMNYQNQKYQDEQNNKYKKLQYQKDLKSQMIQDKEKKFQEGQMSTIELDLNKRHIDGYFNGDHYSQISAPLPGITSRPDFERQKQTDHLDLQLHNQQPNNYIIKKRLRNLSVYEEANKIILNQTSPQKHQQY